MTLPENSTHTVKCGATPLLLARAAELDLWIAPFLQILKLHIKHKTLSKTELKFTLKYPLKLIFLLIFKSDIYSVYSEEYLRNSLNFVLQSKYILAEQQTITQFIVTYD